MKRTRIVEVMVLALSVSISASLCSAATITVQADRPGAQIAPTFIGLFVEDINFVGDGGLYAERVKNRSFEFPDAMMGWSTLNKGAEGYVTVIRREDYTPANANCLRVDVRKAGNGLGVSNEGFRGIGITKGEKYYFSVSARTHGSPVTLAIEVVGPGGKTLLEGKIEASGRDWKQYTTRLEAKDTEAGAKLNVLAMTEGVADLDMISLFPENSARQMYGRPVPGLRKDLVQLMKDVKPGFFRFPGGCIVEGYNLAQRYQWKTTIGDLHERTTLINRWNFEFGHRPAPDYFQSFGLGFFEYFLLSKELGAEPMPIINCGMACQFNTGETVAVEKIGPYVQDALDLIEFANGPADSRWGRKRAEMGHPEPFGMKYLGVGNEQWGPQYIERYVFFEKAIKEKYPDIQLVVATGSDATIFPNGHAEIEYLWSQWRTLKPDVVDEHFYRRYPWFFENTNYYDNYDPDGPEIFVGEYSAMSHNVASPDNRNNLIVALAEAAFLIGCERNAAVVTMSSYAPIAGHVDGWQWKPNLFWFDNLSSYGTPSYYVQKMFSLYRGDVVLPVKTDGAQGRFYVSAGRDTQNGQVVLRVVNAEQNPVNATIRMEGVNSLTPGRAITLAGRPNDENSIQEPIKIAPVEQTLSIRASDAQFRYSFPPYSMTVLKTEVK